MNWHGYDAKTSDDVNMEKRRLSNWILISSLSLLLSQSHEEDMHTP